MKYVCFLFFGVLMACSNESTHTNDFTSNKLGALYSFSDLTEGEELADESFVVKQMLVPPPLKKEDQKIIKTAHLRFETQGLENTHKKILASTKALNGFVSTDNSGKNYNEYFRNITIRIPTENFQKFIDDISKGVNYFDQKDISRRDVSEEFVDLNARLKAKRELENRYLELLTQARNVKEILEIERELSQIREEIEAKQGRLNYLKDKVSLSTINIQFYKYTHETGVTVSYGQKIKNALSGGWDGISVFFIGLLYLWPLLLFMMIIILLIRRWMKRKKRKAQKTK